MPSTAVKKAGKKFMWDKRIYSTEAEAKMKMAEYQKNAFEVVRLNEDGKHLLYTRRKVTEIVLEEGGQPL
jgi:hypothetical protein